MKDGVALRDHLKAAAKNSAAARAELAGPEFPAEGGFIWGAFLELHVARTYHQNGPNPIGYSEIAAWSRLTRQPVLATEVELLRAIDVEWLSYREGKG